MDRDFVLNQLKDTTLKLLAYCRDHDWAGHDPYDALNSRVFQAFPFLDSRIPRLILTQGLKRSPLDLRWLLRIPPTQNPKGLSLFLGSALKLSRAGWIQGEDLRRTMTAKLVELRSPNTPYWAWGYSFPWQTRTIVVPRGAPNLVCTVFVASALLDAYEYSGEPEYLTMAQSSAEYIIQELLWTDGAAVTSFNYPLPSGQVRIHNANFLGAALLCRVARHSGEKKFIEPALRVARYSAGRQREDGSWDYGELPKQRWIDNFHTGYNLEGLRSIAQETGTKEFDECIRRGVEFYIRHFFREDGAPRYFHDRTYPIDIHCVAQSLITLVTFQEYDRGNLPLAQSVFAWALKHMWDERGYFYYRVMPFYKVRTSYMRWSQAWMLLALATLAEASLAGGTGTAGAPAMDQSKMPASSRA